MTGSFMESDKYDTHLRVDNVLSSPDLKHINEYNELPNAYHSSDHLPLFVNFCFDNGPLKVSQPKGSHVNHGSHRGRGGISKGNWGGQSYGDHNGYGHHGHIYESYDAKKSDHQDNRQPEHHRSHQEHNYGVRRGGNDDSFY
jgi:hypothetical protein